MKDAGGIEQTFSSEAYGTLVATEGAPRTADLYAGEQSDGDPGLYYLRGLD